MNKKIYFSIPMILVFLFECKEHSTKPKPDSVIPLIEQLQQISGMQITEINPQAGFEVSYELILTQPVDHQNPNGQNFAQRMYLHHNDLNAPLLIYLSGYAARPNYVYDLTVALNANQLMVTHRYKVDARPLPVNWQYLTIEQAAADHHRIIEYFKEIYSGKRISMGRSKSGMTALFHRRLYPDDVDATVAWVAPIIRGINDPRFEVFLAQAGTEACRNRIKSFQRYLLSNRDQLLPMIQDYINNSPLTFNVDPGIILEYEACEFPFAFWQYFEMGDCSSIPDSNATIEELYTYLKNQGGFDIYSDEGIDYFMLLYYQAYTEFGWYRLINDHLTDLLIADPNPSYSFFTPPNTNIIFQPQIMQDIENWLQTEGNNIIYIYGADDPWTAAAIDLTGHVNSIKIVQQNTNHDVTINQLDNLEVIYSKLEEWLDIEISESQMIPSNVLDNHSNFTFRRCMKN